MRHPVFAGILALLLVFAFFTPNTGEAQRRRPLDLNGWDIPRDFQALPWSPGRMFYSIGWAEDVMYEIPNMPGLGRSGSARLFAIAHLIVPMKATAYRGLKAYALDQDGVTEAVAEEWARTAAAAMVVNPEFVENADSYRAQVPPGNPRWEDRQPIVFMMVSYSFDAFASCVYTALDGHDLPGVRSIRFSRVMRAMRDVHGEVGEQWGRRYVWELLTLSGTPATLPRTEVDDDEQPPFSARSSARGDLRVGHPDFMIEEAAHVEEATPECLAALAVQYRTVLNPALTHLRIPSLSEREMDAVVATLQEALADEIVLDWAMRPDYDFEISRTELELSVTGAMAVLMECPFEAFVAASHAALRETLAPEGDPMGIDLETWHEALATSRPAPQDEPDDDD